MQFTNKLVVGLASSALFDLSESHALFCKKGADVYRQFQLDNENNPLNTGVAFPFIKRLLALNKIADEQLVEVILLSRNDADTGLRVMNSIEHYGLGMTRALFLQGGSPAEYIPALNINLFLSANEADVKQIIAAGHPAGHVLPSSFADLSDDTELRIAFDFDGVLVDDESESVFQRNKDVNEFRDFEISHESVVHNTGPLQAFLQKLSVIQKIEDKRKLKDTNYASKLKISIVTARGAPAHRRVINTMRSWDIAVNNAFFLGGLNKTQILSVLKPHIFFDDQRWHLDLAAAVVPAVHVPFGITNQ